MGTSRSVSVVFHQRYFLFLFVVVKSLTFCCFESNYPSFFVLFTLVIYGSCPRKNDALSKRRCYRKNILLGLISLILWAEIIIEALSLIMKNKKRRIFFYFNVALLICIWYHARSKWQKNVGQSARCCR